MLRLAPFQIAALDQLDDGRPAAMIDADIANAVRDCYDRPGDKRARRVNIQITIIPTIETNGTCEQCAFMLESKLTTPTRSTKTYQGSVSRNGTMLVSREFPDAIDQHSLLPGEEQPE